MTVTRGKSAVFICYENHVYFCCFSQDYWPSSDYWSSFDVWPVAWTLAFRLISQHQVKYVTQFSIETGERGISHQDTAKTKEIQRTFTIKEFVWLITTNRSSTDHHPTSNWSIHTRRCIVVYRVYCWTIIQQCMLVVDNFHVKIRYTYTHFCHMFFKSCIGFVLSNCANEQKFRYVFICF